MITRCFINNKRCENPQGTPPGRDYFRRNLGATGRWIRGVLSVALFAGGALALPIHLLASVVLFLGAAFLLFEALRGWCALRACGVRTKF